MNTPSNHKLQKDSLVLYKLNPARVINTGTKIEIELPDKKRMMVRNKDIILLHPGPLSCLTKLKKISGEVEDACEILSGETTTLFELAELIFGTFTPSSAWSVCELLHDGLFFFGTPDAIQVRTVDEYEKENLSRQAKSAEKEAWNDFIERIRHKNIIDDDKKRLTDLEDFALGKTKKTKILKELKIQATLENAHALLLKLKHWDYTVNPHIERMGFSTTMDYPSLDEMPAGERLDLTHLRSFAIDDEGSKDPDDAISIDDNKIWVHIADVASIVKPDTAADIHARAQVANLYLPDQTVPLLPHKATELLGLGLQETSPALSFEIKLNDDGSIAHVDVHPSLVKVTRLTYAEAEDMLDTSPISNIYALTQKYNQFRKSQDAINLTFPEVKLFVENGNVSIRQIPALNSRQMVTDAMLMAGEAASQFAIDKALPFPFTTQPSPETIENPIDMAAQFAYRKKLKPGIVKCTPDIHASLGVKSYSRITSPLRRYLDLIAHQQIRAHLDNQELLSEQEIMNRIGLSEATVRRVQKLERLSNRHWTLVYLLQNPDWQGKGIVIEIRERFAIVIIPEIALESRISIPRELSLNEEIDLRVTSVDIPDLTANFTPV